MGWGAERRLIEAVDSKKKKWLEEDDEDDEDEYEHDDTVAGTRNGMHRRAPDGGFGWWVLLGSFIVNLLVDGSNFSVAVNMEYYVERLNQTRERCLWVGLASSGSYLIIGPLVGALCFRFGMRKISIFGSLIACAGFVLSAFVTDINLMIVTHSVLIGVGMGMMYFPSIICVSYWFDNRLAMATGVAVFGSGVGQLIIPKLDVMLFDDYLWCGKNVISGAILLNGIVCSMFFRLPDEYLAGRQEKHCNKQRVEIERGIIMKALIEDKKRQRTTSDGSLDNCVITTNNRLIKLEPSLFNCKKNQALRDMLRRLGYSIQSLAVSKNSLQPSDQRILMEALQQKQQQQLNASNGNASNCSVNSKLSSPQFLKPNQFGKRNSTPDFNKTSPGSVGDSSRATSQQVSRSNSIRSNDSAAGSVGVGVCDNGSIGGGPHVNSLMDNSSIRGFPKTKSCDALSQLPFSVIKKLVSERVRSNSECTSGSASGTMTRSAAVMPPLGSSPSLPVGSVDISIQEIPPGSEGAACMTSCYTSSTSIATDLMSQCTREYVPNSSQNMFPGTCMISGEQLEASIRELRRQEWRDKSLMWQACRMLGQMFDIRVLTQPMFLLMVVSSVLTLFAFYVAYAFLSILGMENGLFIDDAEFLLEILSITSTMGRLIVGWLGDRPWVNVLYLNCGTLFCSGVLILFLPSVHSPNTMCVFVAAIGFCLATFLSLRTVLLIKYLGMELIGRSFGLMCVFSGICSFVVTPLSDQLTELSGSSAGMFYGAGPFLLMAGFLLLPLVPLKKRADRREAARQAEEEAEREKHLMGSACAAASPIHCMA